MNQVPHQCGSMMFGGGGQAALCPPLARLKEEHVSLRAQMNAYAKLGEEIVSSSGTKNWSTELAALKDKVESFAAELELHSEREEGTLFPLMAAYIGREVGPIAVMEYEHEQAKLRLNQFKEATENQQGTLNEERAKEIADFALQAHAILTDHFMKEENVLFPMAEKMLSLEDKEQLNRIFE